jgi:hypothetical protein
MIENSLTPQQMGRKMTELALGGTAGCSVVRVVRIVIVLGMTSIAIPGKVVSLGMAAGTIQGGMRSSQSPKRTMIECDIQPTDNIGRVAGNAVRRKIQRLVIGIPRSVIVVQMTGHTIRGQTGELAVHMALGTLGHLVLA